MKRRRRGKDRKRDELTEGTMRTTKEEKDFVKERK